MFNARVLLGLLGTLGVLVGGVRVASAEFGNTCTAGEVSEAQLTAGGPWKAPTAAQDATPLNCGGTDCPELVGSTAKYCKEEPVAGQSSTAVVWEYVCSCVYDVPNGQGGTTQVIAQTNNCDGRIKKRRATGNPVPYNTNPDGTPGAAPVQDDLKCTGNCPNPKECEKNVVPGSETSAGGVTTRRVKCGCN